MTLPEILALLRDCRVQFEAARERRLVHWEHSLMKRRLWLERLAQRAKEGKEPDHG